MLETTSPVVTEDVVWWRDEPEADGEAVDFDKLAWIRLDGGRVVRARLASGFGESSPEDEGEGLRR